MVPYTKQLLLIERQNARVLLLSGRDSIHGHYDMLVCQIASVAEFIEVFVNAQAPANTKQTNKGKKTVDNYLTALQKNHIALVRPKKNSSQNSVMYEMQEKNN